MGCVKNVWITVGLPASGKSTWADKFVPPTGRKRVLTRDDLRLSLGAVHEDGDEGLVLHVRDTAIRNYLGTTYPVDIVVADTNLDPSGRAKLFGVCRAAPCKITVVAFTTTLDRCLYRNDVRWAGGDTKVPNDAITSMHEKFVKTGKWMTGIPLDVEVVWG